MRTARKTTLCILLAVAGVFSAQVTSVDAKSVWCNPANTGVENGTTKASGYRTLVGATGAAVSKDTIIIADGNWVATANMAIEANSLPSRLSGDANGFTYIRAETEWGVRLHHVNVTAKRSYIEIRGIVFDSRTAPLISHIVYEWDHCKFIKCGFLMGKIQGNNHNVGFGSSDATRSSNQYNLMEDCAAWGGGRYVYYSKYGKYNIFRRCIARHDNQENGNSQDDGQFSNFRAYACDYHVYQNCISIDSDRAANYNGGVLQGEVAGYWLGDQYGSVGNEVHGSFSIRDLLMGFYLQGAGTTTNSVVMDLKYASPGGASLMGFWLMTVSGNFTLNNVLGYKTDTVAGQSGVHSKLGTQTSVRDSIFRNISGGGIWTNGGSDTYIDRYLASTGWGTVGHQTNDPFTNGLLYPVRIEAGSTLASQGYGGGQIGPTILKKIGVSGTLYGETGWNVTTSDDLWPFPSETKIKELMSATVDGVSGVYGFTEAGQTLTNYIWGYLGKTVPPFSVAASAGNEQAHITWNRPAEIALATISGFKVFDVSGAAPVLAATVSGNATYGATITGLTNGVPYTYQVTTVDSIKGESGYSSLVRVTPSSAALRAPQNLHFASGQ